MVLAAGEARRFGAPKLLAPFGESTVLGCVVSALREAGLSPIVVVAGAQPSEIVRHLRGSGVRTLANPAPERGMVSSVRLGVAALPDGVGRFLVALGDQPRVPAETISHLLRAHASSGKGIAVPVHNGKRGHPVAFAGRYRAAILALNDSQTLRDLIHANRDDVAEVTCASDAVVQDIDTREQYERELRRRRGDA